MPDSLEEKRGEKAVQRAPSPRSSSNIHDNELPFGSPVSKSVVAQLARIRFLPRELPDGMISPSAMSAETMETHALDVESPGATLQRKKQGGGIVYFPPENLAEYLDSSLVTPITGGLSPAPRGSIGSSNGGGRRPRSFFDECDASNEEAPAEAGVQGAKTDVRASTSTPTPRPEAVFYCSFCMRNKPGPDRRRFEGNGGCSHEFCKKCLENYLYHRIMVGHHSLHPCPKFGEEACRASASNDDVRRMARADVFKEHCERLQGNRGACEECGHRGRRSPRQLSPPPPPPPSPPPTSSHSSRDVATTAVVADEDTTCQSCGSARGRHLHKHHHHHHHHPRDRRQNHPTVSAVGKSKRSWFPHRAAASTGVDATAASADGGDKTPRQRRQRGRRLTLAVETLTTAEAGGREAKKDSARQESPRWWSPREWWTKARDKQRTPRRGNSGARGDGSSAKKWVE